MAKERFPGSIWSGFQLSCCIHSLCQKKSFHEGTLGKKMSKRNERGALEKLHVM